MNKKSVYYQDLSSDIGEIIFDVQDQALNVLSFSVLSEFKTLLEEVKEKNIKALIIKSAKSDSFIAGADIKEIAEISSPSDAYSKSKQGNDLFTLLENLPFPTFAVIHGVCLGGGLEMALACTYRIATDSYKTKIGLPEVSLGIIPGFGGTQRLPKLIGYIPSVDMITSAKTIDGKKALKLGVVDHCCPNEYLDFNLLKWIKSTLKSPYTLLKKRKKNQKKQGVFYYLSKYKLTRWIITKSIKKKILEKTQGHYPAPIKALEVIHKTYTKSISKGIKNEIKAFSEVASIPITNALIQLFETSQKLKKESGISLQDKEKYQEKIDKPIDKIGVVGAGIMGGGIAWLMSKMDKTLRIKDISMQAIQKSFQEAKKIYNFLQKRRRYTPREVQLKMDRLSGCLDYKGFNHSDLVIEAVTENLDLKKNIFKEIENHVSQETIIASNTSSLSINEMAKSLKHPERFIGLHFFNPVNRMPLIEVIPGKNTNPVTIAKVVKISKEAGKIPIVIKDSPGFVVNRILMPYINESGFLLLENNNASLIDRTLSNFGMPMGPLTLLDVVGIDVGYKVADILHQAFLQRMAVCPLMEKLYEIKHWGKKTGQGIYNYNDSKSHSTVNPVINEIKNNSKNIDEKEILQRCLLIMINEASRCLEEKIIDSPEYLDMTMIMGIGFPAFRGGLLNYADSYGVDKIIEGLKQYQNTYGIRFAPSNYLLQMQKEKKQFYSK